MAQYLNNQLLVNTKLDQKSRSAIHDTTTLVSALVAANTTLPREAQHNLNRQMAFQVGTCMGGQRYGQYIANCMDAQLLGIPAPPAPSNFKPPR